MSKNIMLDSKDELPNILPKLLKADADLILSSCLIKVNLIEQDIDDLLKTICVELQTDIIRSELTEVNDKLIDIKKRILFVRYTLASWQVVKLLLL